MKFRPNLSRPRFALLVCLAAVFAGGCVTAKDASKTTSSNQDDEYVYITDTGSHIPRRVKKSEATGTAAGASSVSGDEARERINHQPVPPRPNN